MTSNQHYIPRFYQRYWMCEQSGRVWGLEKKYNNIRLKAISKNCSRDYTYEADPSNPNNVIDDCYYEFENKYSDLYKSLIDSRNCSIKLTYEQKRLICRMFSHFSARHPYNVYENPVPGMITSIFTISGNGKTEEEDRFLRNAYALGQGSTLEDSPGDLEEELMTYNLQLLVSDKNDIIYSDCLIEQLYHHSEYFFPLCPNVVALFSGYITCDDCTFRKITNEEYIRFIGYFLFDNRVKFIYSNQKIVLERIISCNEEKICHDKI